MHKSVPLKLEEFWGVAVAKATDGGMEFNA